VRACDASSGRWLLKHAAGWPQVAPLLAGQGILQCPGRLAARVAGLYNIFFRVSLHAGGAHQHLSAPLTLCLVYICWHSFVGVHGAQRCLHSTRTRVACVCEP